MSRDWRDRGRCRYVDPDTMFPPGIDDDTIRVPGAEHQAAIARAKRVCHACPVIGDCLLWALANPGLSRHGIWAGLTRVERVTLDHANHTGGRHPKCRRCAQTGRPSRVKPRVCARDACGVVFSIANGNSRYCTPECRHAATVGTAAGRAFHRALGEDPCLPCRRAWAQRPRPERHRTRAGRTAVAA